MDDTLKQLGELLLSSIPTIFAFLIVWTAYRLIVHTRLQQVLAERHSLTQGAIEQAQREIASAEARTAEYEQRLREARAQIYKAQEIRRGKVMEARAAALTQTREQAEVLIKNARVALDKEMSTAKAGLEQQAVGLADAIIESILNKPAAAAGGR
jgi:F-type H+-transporting ATPase subunit b